MALKKVIWLTLIFLFGVMVNHICIALEANNESAITKFNSSYKRVQSKVMMRLITNPTKSQLDMSAYDRNPIFYNPQRTELSHPEINLKISELNFSNSLIPSSIKNRFDQIPLSQDDRLNPMAWQPMLDFLTEWDYDQSLALMEINAKVSKEKWGNQSDPKPFQQIVTAYINTKEGEIWVKVEFDPRMRLIDADDEDGDGFSEIYGCIDKSKYSTTLLDYLRANYIKKALSSEEVNDYFYKLSADWYGALRTETLDMTVNRPWPTDKTEPEILKELNGLVIKDATAIIRGKPYGFSIYNIFVVNETEKDNSSKNQSTNDAQQTEKFTASPEKSDMSTNVERFTYELKTWGDGDWDKWASQVSDFRNDIEKKLKERPAEIKGLAGKDDFLFFRGALNYLTSGDLRKQDNNRDPYPAIVDYSKQLKEKGIDFLFVIIPTKAEVFPEKISDFAPKNAVPYVTPYTRKLMLELSEAGVEVIDLYPSFIEERYGNKGDELLYMTQDTHWSDRGLQLAAHIIADRIKQYSWYNDVCKQPISYKTNTVEFTRGGDIRGMLPDDEKVSYRPMKLTAHQVLNPDGTLYDDDKSSPVVILGDSFCGVYQLEDLKYAGLSAHIAKGIGMPVDLIMAYGSGPNIRQRFARLGASAISQKKVVIWTTASRDLYNYWAPWELIRVP
jgi:alginate O-acetyltransferase complex protein AlgJ